MTKPQRYDHVSGSMRENRAFCEALIIQRDLNVPEVDAYADKLANEHWQADPATRLTLYHAMTAYLDGWLEAYDRAYVAGNDDAHAFTLNTIRFAREPLDAVQDVKTLAILATIEGRVRKDTAAKGTSAADPPKEEAE